MQQSSSPPQNGTAALLEVARLQRAMICSAFAAIPLGYGIMVIAGLLVLEYNFPSTAVNSVVWGIIAVLNLIIAFFAFRLARAIYGLPPAFVAALFVMMPCVGLIAVLILNGSAIDYLRRKEVAVGFFGATKEQLVRLAKIEQDGGSNPTPAT